MPCLVPHQCPENPDYRRVHREWRFLGPTVCLPATLINPKLEMPPRIGEDTTWSRYSRCRIASIQRYFEPRKVDDQGRN